MATTTDEQVPAEAEQVPMRARGWGIPVLLAVVVVAVIVGAFAAMSAVANHHDAVTKTYTVPKGTAQKVYEGKTVDLMPAEVKLQVGDSLVIKNDDVETVTVGPFTVRAGETLTQTFRRPQTLIGECAISGSGSIRIEVT
ncbi:MAG: hypothetical protein U0P45_01750 [Acidimicrobiales bacterium]